MTEAVIGLKAESSSLPRAAVDLDQLRISAEKTDAAATKLSAGMAAVVAPMRSVAGAAQAEAQALSASTAAVQLNSTALGVHGAAARAAAQHVALNAYEVRNLGFQVNDLITQLALGQSPFMAFAAQGGQISQQLGNRGARGAVVALGEGIAGLATPANLAVLGIGALAAGVSYFIRTWDAGVPPMEETLKRQAALVNEIKDAYGDAATALDTYTQRSRALIGVQTDIVAGQLRSALQSGAGDLLSGGMFGDILGGGFTSPIQTRVGTIGRQVATDYLAIKEPILELQESIRKGTPDFIHFQDELAGIFKAHPGDSAIRKLIEDTLAATDPLADLQRRLEQITVGVEKITNLHAIISPRGAEDVSMRRLAEQEADRIAKVDRGRVESLAGQQAGFRDAMQAVQAHIEALKLDAQTFGMSADAAEKYRTTQGLINDALKAHIELTPQLRNEIDRIAESESAWSKYNAELKRTVGVLDDARGMSKGFFSDLLEGARSGDLSGAVDKLFGNISGRIEEGISAQLTNSLFGPEGAAGSGPLGGLLQGILGPKGAPGLVDRGSAANPMYVVPVGGLSAPLGAVTSRDLGFGGPAIGSFRAAQELGLQHTGAQNAILDLIARSEGTSKTGYNTTLGYGALTGPQNLVGMTLDQIDNLQTAMLKNPLNRKLFGEPSSALGEFQITRTTLRDLRSQLGLHGDELFDPAMQNRLGMQLYNTRGFAPWEGMRGVDQGAIDQALKQVAGTADKFSGSFDSTLMGLTNTMGQTTSQFGGQFGSVLDNLLSQFGGGGTMGFIQNLVGAGYSGLYAMGGTIPAGKWGIAGERGPERVYGPATVVPGGATTVNNHIRVVNNGAPVNATVGETEPDGQGGFRTDVMLEGMVASQLAKPRVRRGAGLGLRPTRR